MKNKRKKHWITYLVFGIILTSFATTVTLSRYMSNVSGSGTISVATIDTNISSFTFTPNTLNKPGTTETMRFNIVNFTGDQISEVDQSYTITINSTGNLPFNYELQCIDTGSNGTGINLTRSAVNTNTELNGGILNHSIASTHQYELTITWPSNMKDILLTDELELITIVINAEQIIN